MRIFGRGRHFKIFLKKMKIEEKSEFSKNESSKFQFFSRKPDKFSKPSQAERIQAEKRKHGFKRQAEKETQIQARQEQKPPRQKKKPQS